jgi:hypothetical protein
MKPDEWDDSAAPRVSNALPHIRMICNSSVLRVH